MIFGLTPREEESTSTCCAELGRLLLCVFQCRHFLSEWENDKMKGVQVTPPLHEKTKIVTNDVEVSEFLVQLSPAHTHDPGFNPGFSFNSEFCLQKPKRDGFWYLSFQSGLFSQWRCFRQVHSCVPLVRINKAFC